jgi:IS30 family transposase
MLASWAQAGRFGLATNTQRRLSAKEREPIHAGLAQGKSGSQLAALLGRDASVFNREIARNGGRKAYSSVEAQACALSSAQARRTQQKSLIRPPSMATCWPC